MRHHHNHHRPIQPTFEELLAKVRDLPEGYRGQILDGAVHVCEPPCAARAHTLGELSATLMAGSPLGDPAPASWTFLSNAELAVGVDGLISADIAGFRRSQDELAREASPIRHAPSWVCEVLGDGARGFTRTVKRKAYAELGVSYLWLADPDARVLEVFQNQRGRWLLLAALSDELNVAPPPFEDLHFDAIDLWLPAPRIKTPSVPPSARRH